MSKQVFISYPRDNAAGQAKARALYRALQKEQISTFLDEHNIEPGDRWLKVLKEGVAESKIMLAVIAAASGDRKWVEKEFNEAQKYDIRIIPILAEAVDLPMQFTDIQAVSLYGSDADAQQQKLFKYIRKHLGIDVIGPLIKDANKAKRTEAYDLAAEKWQQVLAISPEYKRATKELERLAQLNALKQQGASVLQQLMVRLTDIQPVFMDVASILNQSVKRRESPTIIALSQQLLENSLSAQDYIQKCKAICKPLVNSSQLVQTGDYVDLAERITKGDVVLFLGTDIAREYGEDIKSEQQVAAELAQETQYQNFDGGLSTVAEYLRLKPGVGASGLWGKLESVVEQVTTDTRLYPLLAKVDAPLILISASYDEKLEQQFQAANKLYVQLSSIICRSEDYDIGHVVVSFSDGSQPDKPYLMEELSALKLYEQGYSIIYKIRGSCVSAKKQTVEDKALQRDALTVSESDYFTVARHSEKIIPSYLTSLLRGRGFLFVGFTPARWEQRLLVDALLSKRKHASDDCYTVGVSQDPLEAAYWKKQHVHHYDVNLPELDEHIEEVLR